MLIRIRSNVGQWRIEVDRGASVSDLMAKIAETRPDVVYERPLSRDPACSDPLDVRRSLVDQGIDHGGMIHCRVDAATCAEASMESSITNMRRVIAKDGSVQMVHTSESDTRGFRKGQLPLRDMKMQWTLNDFIALDSQYEFKIQRQEEAICKGVSLDSSSVNSFQTYLRNFQFSRQRCGFLYGRFTDDDTKVLVEAIYEPPQEADPDSPEGFHLLDDDKEDQVEQLAQLLGLTKVGWIFGHPPRAKGFSFSAHEIILAAEFQLEAAQGVEKTPFVTVKVTLNDDGKVEVDAFQVSQQCMQMVAEEALQVGDNRGFLEVNETFSAIQEGKNAKELAPEFFLTTVPIVQHQSEVFVSTFPKFNRQIDDRLPSKDELKKQLSKSGSSGWTFVDLLADFNLLIFLCDFLDLATDMPKICDSINNRQIPLDEGYKLIIASMCNMDGSY
jgi:nuclear protein localization family protein 4